MNLFKKPECHIMFNEGKHHHRHKLKDRNKKSVRYPTFFSEDDISGKFELIKPSGSFDYSSITVELIGLIDNYNDPKSSVRFLSLSKDISKNGSLSKDITTYNFIFKKVKLPYESYKGETIGVKYVIKVNINKMMRTMSYEEEFVVVKAYDESILKKNDEPISMNVGIKELLSVLIEFDHVNYGIHGTLKGFVSFGKVNLLLTKMEVQLIKKETIFGGAVSKRNEKQKIIATFELIDGGPYKNETIPFRFFLEPYNLTPSYIDIAGNFSVRYYLNLIIKDQKNNRYFKQKEIFLFRLLLKNNNYLFSTLNTNGTNNNQLSDIEHLKDFITEPIDYGDYFSVFNDIDDEKETSKDKINIKEPEPDDFYFRSTLTGISIDKDEEEDNQMLSKSLRNMRSNTTYDIRKKNLPLLNDRITNRDVLNDINNKKNTSVSNKKSKKGKGNQVINIKEKNKYKNNDILINDNYYNTDNYIIYENSYQNVFDDKLKKNRIKYSNLTEKNKIDDDDEEEKQKEISNSINDDNVINSINDYNLYYPNEPFSNSVIISNFPSNYNNIGQSNDFRKNLMGGLIKKK